MVPTERRSQIDSVASDPKSLTVEIDSALSPRRGEGQIQRICIDALCRSPLSPRGFATNVLQKKESVLPTFQANQGLSLSGADDGTCENARVRSDPRCSSGTKYFSVHLVVAAVADGHILSDHGSRKTKCVLDQLTRNVSKEQNQVCDVKSYLIETKCNFVYDTDCSAPKRKC